MAISLQTAQEIQRLCEQRYKALTDGGCDEDVAADRVFDTVNCALDGDDLHCFDPRDRLFENKLRTIVQRQRDRR